MMKDQCLVECEKGLPGTDVPNPIAPLVSRDNGELGATAA
jgi:hypothetical protein